MRCDSGRRGCGSGGVSGACDAAAGLQLVQQRLVLGGGSGVSSLNTLTGSLTLATTSTGTTNSVTPTGSTITLNIGTAQAVPLSGITGLGSGVGTALGNGANASGGFVTNTGAVAQVFNELGLPREVGNGLGAYCILKFLFLGIA